MKSRTGYIYFDENKNRWVGRVMLPADPVTGKRKSVRRFGLTKTDVRKKLSKILVKIEDHGFVSIPTERMTFADLAKEFEERELIPAQYIGEKKVSGRRDLKAPKSWLKSLTEHFGKKKISQITHSDIKSYKHILIKRPVRRGRHSGNGVRTAPVVALICAQSSSSPQTLGCAGTSCSHLSQPILISSNES
ncbi:MAG: hypothetical protein L0220_31905 [Acidobacteria bacterium]|nr:hypothetical protein [Acidobacteriota bacterium]